jgi:phospholipase D
MPVPVWIDDQLAIAHNKVLIIDGHLVITGSFNFTKSAETRNAENVVMIDSPRVAGWFAANWDARRAVSRAFEAE